MNNQPLSVTYIGGPTVIFEIGALRLMTDPTLDEAGSFIRLNERMTEKKLKGPAINPEGFVDIVLLSHDHHFDNLDNAGRSYLSKAGLVLTTKSGAERLGANSIGLKPGDFREFELPTGGKLIIEATPARHGPAGIEPITGEVIGFHLSILQETSQSIYITGDTVYYNEIEKLAARINPAYVFIFAGAARPRGPFNLTMSTNDALDTAFAFKSAMIVPIHSDGWSHYTENNDNLHEAFDILGIGKRLKVLEPGIPTKLFN
ncbi:MBL fold metallo-hydrolase [Pedobacter aquatilis]|uniref:MBL fold metallo-hydrolase n=1 Tax=Pedobacter aquatilis TaxID=351343 RepID=UPI0025B62307|nr:MBL fold metallo-hydrolase [Pedobacter aquatilis]MDN3588664.1 MBL fold metallo-hydrolase [Pedobacter aquatilis]